MNRNLNTKNILVVVLVTIIIFLLGAQLFDDELSSTLEDTQQTHRASTSIQTSTSDTQSPVKTLDARQLVPAGTRDGRGTVVTYTNSGFVPPVLEVQGSESVTFVNSSSKPMWVTSLDHPTAKDQYYPGFDQGKSVSTGGTYVFTFTQTGVWGYKNLNNEKHLGAISVISQSQ